MTGLRRTLALLCLIGCGGEDRVVLPTPARGPVVTFMGLANSEGLVIQPTPGTDGIDVYAGRPLRTGRHFWIVVEGMPGLSGAEPGLSAYAEPDTELPDLQVVVSQNLGDGSPAVCDYISRPPVEGTPAVGGVAATTPASFEPVETVAPRVNDLSCRFVDGTGDPVGREDPLDSCVVQELTKDPIFVNDESTIQFCGFVDSSWPFLPGRTLVTARLRDVDGNVGPPAQIYVEVNE